MAGEKITSEEEKTTTITEKSVNNVETQNNPDIQAIKNETVVELSETKKDVLAPVQEDINDKLTETEENSDDKLDDIANPLDIHNKNIQALKDLKKDIKETKKQLNTIARWTHATAICEQAKIYRDGLKDSINIINKNIRYERKLKNNVFTKDIRDIEDTKLMVAKIKAWIATTDKYSSFTLQGHNPAANKGIDKKDMYNGVERTKNCTPAEAEAAFAKCQGGGSLAKQERCKFVEEKTGIRQNLDKFLTPAGSNVVTGAVKAIPTIIQVFGAVKALKGARGLLFGSSDPKEREKYRKKLGRGTAMFGAVTFLDPIKSYETLKNTFSDLFNKGKDSTSSLASQNIVDKYIDKNGKLLSIPESNDAMTLTGTALSGTTISELNAKEVFKYDSNGYVSDIDFGHLKGIYSTKNLIEKDKADIYGKLIVDVNNIEKVYKAMSSTQRKEFISNACISCGISKDVMDDIQIQDKTLGAVISHTLRNAGSLNEGLERMSLEDKILQDKNFKEYITTYGIGKFMKQIMELPLEMRNQIYEGDIKLNTYNDQLQLISHNTETTPGVQTLINTKTQQISVITPDGKSHQFMTPMTSLAEGIWAANKTNEIIKNHHNQYLNNIPFFYNQSLGSFGNDVSVGQGERKLFNPGTRFFGKNEAVINGWFDGVPGQASTFKKNMDKYTAFLNGLNIWKNNQSENYINTTVLPQIKIKYPGLSDKEYNELVKGYMGIYRLRGDLPGLMKVNAQEVGQGISDTANNIKNFTLQKSSELGSRLGTGGKRVYEKGGIIFQSIDGKRIDMQNWISQSRNKKDQIWKDICAKAGVKREDVKNLTFEQLPEHIGYAIRFTFINILKFTGNIVEGVWGKGNTTPHT